MNFAPERQWRSGSVTSHISMYFLCLRHCDAIKLARLSLSLLVYDAVHL